MPFIGKEEESEQQFKARTGRDEWPLLSAVLKGTSQTGAIFALRHTPCRLWIQFPVWIVLGDYSSISRVATVDTDTYTRI